MHFDLNAKKEKTPNQIHSVDEEPFWQGTILPKDYSVKQEKQCLNGVKASK